MFTPQNLTFDCSTYARFEAWASGNLPSTTPLGLSAVLASFGFVQTNDTGQVMWSGMNITAASRSGSNTTYTYNSLAGQLLAVGRAMTITGMTNGGNNGTFVITSFTGTTSGTFTVVNASGVNESGSSGVVTRQSTVPTTSSTLTGAVYEIWKANDSNQATCPVFLKIEYGQIATNIPGIAITFGSGSNGSGTVNGGSTGGVMTRLVLGNTGATSQGAGTVECDFSGDGAGSSGNCWFSVIMWRNAPSTSGSVAFGFDRQKTNVGGDAAIYYSWWAGTTATTWKQQSIQAQSSTLGPLETCLITISGGTLTSHSLSGNIPALPVFPSVGFLGNPLMGVITIKATDTTEGNTAAINFYGANHTYLFSITTFAKAAGGGGNTNAMGIRWE